MDDVDIESILSKYKATIYDVINIKKNNFINTRIKKIFVINLADNIIRRNYILVLMKKYNINFSLVVVDRINEKTYNLVTNTKITKDELGCTLSHLWCLRQMIKENYENSIIFEDDVIFHKNFKEMFMDIFKNDYDFLLLGACDFSFKSLNKDRLSNKKKMVNVESYTIGDDIKEDTENKPFSKNLYRPHENSVKLYGAHANYYSLEAAKLMYESKSRTLTFFDKDYMLLFDNFDESSFICYPNLVVSDISSSNLHHSYPFFSKSEELYYINCFDNFKFTDYNFIYLNIIIKNKGVKIRDDDTYDSFMTRLIRYQFSNSKEREHIRNRISMDFFTINDVERIRINI